MINTRALRDEQGLTLDALSAAAGIDRTQLWRYEHGKASPSIDRAYRLARALGVSLDDLYVHEDEPSTPPVACAMSGAGNDEVRGAQSPQADRAADPTEGA